MNIMMFSAAAWDNKNSVGNTFSNWFCGKEWENDNFSHFYVRKQYPCNEILANYYNLSAIDILKGILHGKIKGRLFNSETAICYESELNKEHAKEQENISKLHRNKNQIVYLMHELVWMSRVWINEEFKRFIKENSPDIFFAFSTNVFILSPVIDYLKKNTNCKIVLFIADDVYGMYSELIIPRKIYSKRLFERCIKNADVLYAVSEEMSTLYANRFKRQVKTVYKGCDLSQDVKKNINSPIKMVYAGNLLWGRDDILHKLALELEEINKENIQIMLEIYTGATITPEMSEKLNVGVSSKIMGSKPYNQIKKIMHNADIVLHVESFEEPMKKIVKYSLSTKIMDCLQSGALIVGIGPAEVASIRYLSRIKGTIVIDDIRKISVVLNDILSNQEDLLYNIQLIREYAEEHHEISRVQKKLRDDFSKLITAKQEIM